MDQLKGKAHLLARNSPDNHLLYLHMGTIRHYSRRLNQGADQADWLKHLRSYIQLLRVMPKKSSGIRACLKTASEACKVRMTDWLMEQYLRAVWTTVTSIGKIILHKSDDSFLSFLIARRTITLVTGMYLLKVSKTTESSQLMASGWFGGRHTSPSCIS